MPELQIPQVRSPLEGVYHPGIYGAKQVEPGVIIQERKLEKIIQIAAWPETVGTVAADLKKALGLESKPNPGLASGNDSEIVIQTAPLKFLAIGEEAELSSLTDKFSSDQAVCLDLSHSLTALRISGTAVRSFLNRGLTLDLEDKAFPVRATATTALNSISVILHRVEADIYDLYIPRAFARVIWEWIEETGLQFGMEIR